MANPRAISRRKSTHLQDPRELALVRDARVSPAEAVASNGRPRAAVAVVEAVAHERVDAELAAAVVVAHRDCVARAVAPGRVVVRPPAAEADLVDVARLARRAVGALEAAARRRERVRAKVAKVAAAPAPVAAVVNVVVRV